jgi:hypothetical protein
MIARLALAAALLGSAAGATAVLAADDHPARRPAPAVAPPAGAVQPTPTPLAAREPRIVLQVSDPEGGTPWAVRHFTAPVQPRTPPKHLEFPDDVIDELGAGVLECWELGRLQGDRFGWTDGHGTFRTTPPGHYQSPNLCYSATYLRKIGAAPMRLTTVTYPPGRAPQPARAITWGVASDEVAAIVPKGGQRIPVRPGGVFLSIAAGQAPPGVLHGVIERRNGTRKRFNHGSLPPAPRATERPKGTATVAAIAPDPAGGEPWAVLVRRGTRDGLCFDIPGRLVGTQLGHIDRQLDIFMATPGFELACGRLIPTRENPLRVDTLISSASIRGEDRGRIERRVLDGRIVYWGRTSPDVTAVTIKTPRDVRTLIPSQDFHMFVAVYDGLFPGGKATATAHLRDGRTLTRSLHVE